jgi:hypothetical protein
VPTYRCRITVRGDLGRAARQAFEEFEIEFDGARTALTADLDQAALFSALNQVQSLGLELVELKRIPDDAARPEGA